MSDYDLEKLRIDDDDYNHVIRNDAPAVDVGRSFVGVTVAIGTYPTSAGVFFGVQPKAVTGTETEGGAATTTSVGSPILAKHIGTSVPAVGTEVLVTFLPYRWVFEF